MTKIRRNNDGGKGCITSAQNGPPLDTLAQLRTNDENPTFDGGFEVVSNTEFGDKKTLTKRAKRKALSYALLMGLIRAAEHDKTTGKRSLLQSYWNSYHCTAVLQRHTCGKVTAKYCKNRWCLVCSAIRTAQNIIQYLPVIESWSNAQLVTLTERNMSADRLSERLKTMHRYCRQIIEGQRLRVLRGKAVKPVIGIRKLECTYNALRDDYHPHFHFIVDSLESAEILRSGWLKRNDQAKYNAQDIRPADSTALVELFKYMTKVAVKGENGVKRVVYADALNIIYKAMAGRRVVQPFGVSAQDVGEDPDKVKQGTGAVMSVWNWEQAVYDWVDVHSGDLLTGYIPCDGMKDLMEKKVIFRVPANEEPSKI